MGDQDSIFHKYRFHNPNFFARGAYDSRRSTLFTTMRKSVPGAFSKWSAFSIIVCFAYGSYRFTQGRQEQERADVVKFSYLRKSFPFLLAVTQRRNLALKNRRRLTEEELFRDDMEAYEALRRTVNDPTLAMPDNSNGTLTSGGMRRSSKGIWRDFNTTLRGNDDYMHNIPTEHF